MAEDAVPNNQYSHDHLRVSGFAVARDYVSPNEGGPRPPKRNRQDHADLLARQIANVQEVIAEREISLVPGFAIEDSAAILTIVGAAQAALPDFARKGHEIRVGNIRNSSNGNKQATLVMPRASLSFFSDAVEEYRNTDTAGGKPARSGIVEPIDGILPGWINQLWTDPRPLPESGVSIWWECWCWPDRTETLRRAAAKLKLRVSENQLFFPEMTVIPIYASRSDIERIIASVDSIGELRHASDSPRFYVHDERQTQHSWVESLSDRIELPDDDAPAVCILDSGVNREHPLIVGSLDPSDMHAYDSSWGTADDRDHGTYMAGLALFGDLTPVLSSSNPVPLGHQLESVKLVEPPGGKPHSLTSYGSVTQAGFALAEQAKPQRARVFCLAMSNQDISGERPSSWSSALDQSAAGAAPGDPDEELEDTQRRLILVAAGNVPDTATVEDHSDPDEFPIEDPAQAWNALTIGGFTDLDEISEPELKDWKPLAGVGETSPYSRASTDWPHSTTAIKPELVFEAGNRAVSPADNEIASGVDSISLLTTGSNVLQRPLDTFWATSAATAQAARLAAMIQARYPEAWPETVRALMVHSARWSPPMRSALLAVTKPERKSLLRHFGYGIPSLERAVDSAGNDLALVAEAAIQPYKRVTGKGIRFCHAHFYELPWPSSILEELNNAQVELKVTLSYFVEPNPGQMSPAAADRYRSVGLRFANKRAGEPLEDFYKRVNKLERKNGEKPEREEDPGWMLGPTSFSAGSLHCDVWTGPAIELADRRHFAVTPIIGWWRDRAHLKCYDRETRYSLVISLSSPDNDVSLYSETEIAITSETEIEIN